MTKCIRIVHVNGVNYVPELCDLDEEGSLVRFYNEGVLQFAIRREDFLFSEVVERS